MPCAPGHFLQAIAPFRGNLVVGEEKHSIQSDSSARFDQRDLLRHTIAAMLLHDF
jgi:hypothetical protein